MLPDSAVEKQLDFCGHPRTLEMRQEPMTKVPKIVHERLRAAAQAQRGGSPHPDADSLTAFAEQGLSQIERQGVVEHLALCADCRNVLALALPAQEMRPTAAAVEPAAVGSGQAPVFEKSRQQSIRSWFAVSGLRWAALAAGVVAVVLVVGPALRRHTKPIPAGEIARQAALPAEQAAPSTPPASEITADRGPESIAREATPNVASHRNQKKARIAAPTLATDQPMALASNRPSPRLAPVAPNASPFPTATDASTTIEASAEATDATTRAFNISSGTQNQEEIVRAKPPLEPLAGAGETDAEKKSGAATVPALAVSRTNGMLLGRNVTSLSTLKPVTTWKLTSGVLQGSADGGTSWQTSLQTNQAILCFKPRGQEIWAGGQSGTLMHSTDNGATWNAVPVSYQGQSLNSDIVTIDVPGPAQIILTTANHEVWSSNDAGKTWLKK